MRAVAPHCPACLLPNSRLPPQVLEDVRGIIAEQLGTDLAKVTPDSKFVDLGADSLDTVEIMMALEEMVEPLPPMTWLPHQVPGVATQVP